MISLKLFVQKRNLPLKNLILLLVLVISMITAAWAWFISSSTASANGMSVSLQALNNLTVSLDNTNYYQSVDITKSSSVMQNLDFLDITGDGQTFLRPILNQSTSGASPDTTKTWSAPTAGKEYLSFNVYLRSNTKCSVYLNQGSSVDPVSSTLTWDSSVTDTSSYNPSTYGNFSKDCLVGATRVSVIDASNSLRFVWIPRPDIYLNTSTTPWTVTTGLTSGSSFIHQYYDASKTLQTSSKTITSLPTSPDSTTLVATLSGTPDSSGYYYSNFHVNIWIDGCDAEARRALSGGQFNVNLALKAVF
ncbi:MAG: hypothetical protein Q8876_04630 [Bacillota bacterium]|nr:hypothetical protein [Bacillota bacterium]